MRSNRISGFTESQFSRVEKLIVSVIFTQSGPSARQQLRGSFQLLLGSLELILCGEVGCASCFGFCAQEHGACFDPMDTSRDCLFEISSSRQCRVPGRFGRFLQTFGQTLKPLLCEMNLFL